jgi:drug/metabolite transporter (DMT)-like permease
MTPVAFSAACTCTIASLLLEGTTFEALTPMSVFGFFSLAYIGYAFYLGGGAGVGGHTLVNTLLRYLSPLLVSTALLMEPLIGSLLGAIAGVQGIPGIYTFLGGPVVICGLLMIVYGESPKGDNDNHKKNKEANAQEKCGTKSTI